MTMHLYVYYEVPVAGVAAMRERVRAMHSDLLAATSVRARLQRRADPSAGAEHPQTWMEVYPDAPPGFEERLAAAAAAFGVDRGVGTRHVERFDDAA